MRGGLANQQATDGGYYQGDVGCVTESLATKTVLITRTGLSTTIVETVPTVVTEWETSFVDVSDTASEPSKETPWETPAGTTRRDRVGTPGAGVRDSPGTETSGGSGGSSKETGGSSGDGDAVSETVPAATARILTMSIVSTLTIMHTITTTATCSS